MVLARPPQKTLTVPTDSEMVFRYGEQNPPKTVEARAYTLNKLEKTELYRPASVTEYEDQGVVTPALSRARRRLPLYIKSPPSYLSTPASRVPASLRWLFS